MLLPLLEKLTTGKIAQLLAPNYSDLSDPRPIFDWMQVIRKRAVVYVGSMRCPTPRSRPPWQLDVQRLVSGAGHIYKFGIDDGCPAHRPAPRFRSTSMPTSSTELMGDEFIPMINKGRRCRGTGHVYTPQTLSDIEARIGNRAKAGQVVGNFNNLFMLRVRETATAELLTRQLPKTRFPPPLVSGATDSSDPHRSRLYVPTPKTLSSARPACR